MDRSYDLLFTHGALMDLEDAFYGIHDNAAAKAFVTALRAKCERNLTSTPRMGVRLQLPNGRRLFALTSSRYRIFYGIDEEVGVVTVFRILHTSRNIARILDTSA